MKDPYNVLGIARGATQEEVRKAYRRLARRHHPDHNTRDPQAEEKFKDISAAHDLLSNIGKRDMFDRGEVNADGTRRSRCHAGKNCRTRPKKPFESFFHKRYAKERSGIKINGADVSYTLKIDFIDAAMGARKRVSMTNGKCLDVNIPPATQDGQVLRLRNQGMEGVGGGESGDANVKIAVNPHPVFTADNGDIHMELAITLTEAVLGGSVRAPTIDGEVSLNIPEGTNTGAVLRLNGKGLKMAGGRRGNQYIKLKIVLPDKPNRELADFVKNWKTGSDYNIRRDKINAD